MTSIQLVLEDLAKAMWQDKEIKGIKTGKEERELPLLVHDTIVYTEKLMKSAKKVLALINKLKS